MLRLVSISDKWFLLSQECADSRRKTSNDLPSGHGLRIADVVDTDSLERRTMLKQFVSVGLMMLMIWISWTTSVSAQARSQNPRIEELKQKVQKLGTGTNAHVNVETKDGRKLEGYVSGIADDHFVVTNGKNGATTVIEYSQVSKLKGNNGLTAGKIAWKIGRGAAIVAAVAGAVVLLGFLLMPKT